MKRFILMFVLLFQLTACNGQNKTAVKEEPAVDAKSELPKTDAEWQKVLTPEQYEVLREKGTERPFTGVYVDHFEKGHYACAACGNVLFTSDSKFKSDCGWPSFDQAIKGSVKYTQDTSFGMVRTEVTCAKCDGHLGHVFDDGPTDTTGKRFCTNSISITFVPEKKQR
ncbi:peptide-methionine (R)-S-oxide reductase MsrB [Flavobacterium sp.]|uniref:peptide-methionine (R)-S-oxide reductase MsrB n=1 Tax=Flavobacterium sp. TaxID=239 RepID=UPI00261CFB4C|nr:peptide-methionine (R)-S-oxide reductase MsrB [Flavobacterium sp.]